jgi:hypothetical protein
MTPYAQAWILYHSFGRPGVSWADVVGAHFHHGAVVSTDGAFVMARRVNAADADAIHLSPLEYREDGDCWMIWIAAGRLESLLALLEAHPTEWVSYQRRDSERLRRVKTARFLRHVLAESPAPAAPATAARVLDRAGKGQRGSGRTPPRG